MEILTRNSKTLNYITPHATINEFRYQTINNRQMCDLFAVCTLFFGSSTKMKGKTDSYASKSARVRVTMYSYQSSYPIHHTPYPIPLEHNVDIFEFQFSILNSQFQLTVGY